MIACEGNGCPAMIEFAVNAADVGEGKERPRRIPLDIDPSGNDGGTVAVRTEEITGRLLYRSCKPGTELEFGESRRVSHYTTCTEPGRFSSRSKPRK